MDVVVPLLAALNAVMVEAALFAAAGFLLLGLGDLAVDAIWLGLAAAGRTRPRLLADLPEEESGLLAVFVPAWDEAAVIGPMLRGALCAWGEGDYRLYVGCYPNDPATLAEVRAADDGSGRVRIVIGPLPGPTTKADCLNRLWEALRSDEAAEGRRALAVVLHDAEDVVHPAELALFRRLAGGFDLVQLPVLPLIHPDARWVGGHYADEFAQAHGKELPVRQWLGAGLPSAGVGCAFSRGLLERLAADGGPFDAESLTEDYELGLKLREAGGRSLFARVVPARGTALIATREFFPGTLRTAVGQKARWMAGIALSGWDRLGWSGGAAERWMRLRDRQSLLAAVILAAGYFALLLWLLLAPARVIAEVDPAPLPPVLSLLVWLNLCLLAWRMTMRAAFTAAAHGWREGLRSLPRAVVGNVVAIGAAAAALARYRAIRRTGRAPWGKTAHVFPASVPAE